jgi:hypothetical protein
MGADGKGVGGELSLSLCRASPPLPCRASPHRWGDRLCSPARSNLSVLRRASHLPISLLVGEMPGRAEGVFHGKPSTNTPKRHATSQPVSLPCHFTRTGRWKPPRMSKFNMALPSAPFGGFLSATPVSLSSRHWRRDRVCRTGTSGAKLEARFLNGGPAVSRGRPFSADPCHEVSRLTLISRADPASPARLPVYPMTGRNKCKARFRQRGKSAAGFFIND